MTDIKTLLHEADPLVVEPRLPRVDIDAMRRRLLLARTPQSARGWTWTLTLATALTVVVVAGIGVTRRNAITAEQTSTPPSVITQQHGEIEGRRQLQFATPGGTRVIWVFNADFETR